MAYQSKNLSAIAYSNGFTLWHYRTPDSAIDIDSIGYFNPAAAMLRPGDFIFVNAAQGTAPTHGVVVVVTNNGTVVDAADFVSFAVGNKD